MSLDRSGIDADEPADHPRPVARSTDQTPDSPQARRPAEISSVADTTDRAPRLPSRQEQIEAHWKARETAGAVYAAWDGANGTPGGSPAPDAAPPREPGPGSQERHSDDGHAAHEADQPTAAEEALRKRVDELEADKVSRERQLFSQAKTIAGQSERIESLESYVGQITTAVRELRQEQGESQPSAEIAERAGGTQAERAKPQQKRQIPSDTVNNVISVAAGGVITDLAFHIRDLSPEYAGIGASGVALAQGSLPVGVSTERLRTMPIIDPKIEEPARDMLGHAIRGELQDLAALIQSVGGERYRQVLGLCLTAAAYVAVDVSNRWPTDADVHEIARVVAEHETEVRLGQADVYDYLSGAALGFRPPPEALGDDISAATLPVFVTGSMVFTFKPKGQQWWEYLDQIWSAYEAAEAVDMSVLPALQVRARMLKEVEGRGAVE